MGFALSKMSLTAPSFETFKGMPISSTAYADNRSPALRWDSVPDGVRSFALFCHDPDAPVVAPDGTYGFVHWILYNIPAEVRELAEDIGVGSYTSGANQFGDDAYFGPQPPPGHGMHTYYFVLLALSREPDLEPGLGLQELLRATEPDIIGMARLVGTYELCLGP